MNRFLQYFNTAGVLALAALCAAQWQANRRVNLEAAGLESARLEQTAKLAEQGRVIQGLTADLDRFREQLSRVAASSAEADQRAAVLERENRQLAAERDQLKTSITNWATAVAQRDTRLGEAAATLQQAAEARNDAVRRFNELAARHNTVVSNLNARTTEFNALVERYNALTASAKAGSSP